MSYRIAFFLLDLGGMTALIIDPAELTNPDIPSGFGKFTTLTYQSPSGNFQVHFYMDPVTGEPYYGLDYKVKFNSGGGGG